MRMMKNDEKIGKKKKKKNFFFFLMWKVTTEQRFLHTDWMLNRCVGVTALRPRSNQMGVVTGVKFGYL